MRKGIYLQHIFYSEDSMEPYPNLYLKAGAQAPTQSTNPLSINVDEGVALTAGTCVLIANCLLL